MKKLFYLFLFFGLHLQINGQTITEIVVDSDVHNTLEAAVIAADLATTLSGPGPFTVFAPTDDAFSALPDGTIDALLADPSGDLTDILLYHVVSGEIASSTLTDGQVATTVNGEDITVSIVGSDVFINGTAKVVVADLQATNGIVHVIDVVLIPPAAPTETITDIVVASDVHNTLEAAVISADLAGTLSGPGPFTVFAPTDDAFNSLPDGTLDALLADPSGALTEILLYHVVSGEIASSDLSDGQIATTVNGADITVSIFGSDVFINGNSKVIIADIPASNGIVHVVDVVLIPPTPPTQSITEIVVASEDHNTLEAAVIAAGLAETLSGEGPFTVFAPTDAAFDLLPDGTLDALLADAEGALKDIILYHAIAANAPSSALENLAAYSTVLGPEVVASLNGGKIFINDVQVVLADIEATNGVVHVVDAVLLPPSDNTVLDVVVESDVHTTLETAVIAAGLDGALGGEGSFTVFAPTDAAFALVPEETLNSLLADPMGALSDVLLYHVLGQKVFSSALFDGLSVTTLQGSNVDVTETADGFLINNALVSIANIHTSNGIVHVIDAVLVPGLESGLNLLPDQNLSVYPVPATDQLNLVVPGSTGNDTWQVNLYNSYGQMVQIEQMNDGALQINVSDLPRGAYFIQLRNDVYEIRKKVLIK